MKKFFSISILSLTVIIAAGMVITWHHETRAAGTILYVDKDSACPGLGTSASPYCSIQNALNVVNAGDTIRIRDAASPYDENAILTRSGTSASPIIIEPDAGASPTLRYTGNGTDASALELSGVNYVTVRNLTFDGAGVYTSAWGLMVRSGAGHTGIQVIGNTFKNWGGTAAQADVAKGRAVLAINGGYCNPCPGGPLNTLIQGNTFDSNRQKHIMILHANGTVVEQNTFTNTKCGRETDGARNATGVHIIDALPAGNSSGTIVRHNTFHDWEPRTSCGITNTGSYDTFAAVWCDVGPKDGLVDGNRIYNIDQGNTDGTNGESIGIFIEHQCANWVVKNNLISDIGQAGIRNRQYDLFSDPATWTLPANHYYNNTVYNVGVRSIEFASGKQVMKNNLFWNAGQVLVRWDQQTPTQHDLDYNLYWQDTPGNNIALYGAVFKNFSDWKTSCNCDSHSLNVNPQLVNPAAGDFHLTSSSPAINAGTALTTVLTDFEGTPRPQGTAYDIGADEFGTAPTPTPTPLTSAYLNAGGPQYTATDGTYTADSFFSGGFTYTNTKAIANTTDDVLYNTERYGNPFSYDITLQNGNYNVTLKFAETFLTAPNQRIFSVTAEGTTVLSTIDIYASAGADTAYERTFPVTVSDGTLNLTFSASIENAKVNAIKVVPASSPVSCSQYTPSTTIPTGYASPYDVVSSPTTNLMNATCDTTSVRLDLGKGDPLQYIYNQGYLFKTGGTNWTPISYTSTESLIANAWYPKTATTNVSLTSTELSQPSYALAYLCTWIGSGWKCGCRDSACTQSYWQIQSFKK